MAWGRDRFQKASLIFAAIVFSLTFVPTDSRSDESINVIKAKAFMLVDDAGIERGGIKLVDNKPVIYMADKKGVLRAYLAERDNSVRFALLDKEGETKIELGVDDEGKPKIYLCRDGGQLAIGIALNASGHPGIALFDKANQAKLLMQTTDKYAGIALAESRDQPRLLIQSRDGKGAAISLHDSNKKPKIYLAMMDDRPRFSLEDPQGSGLFSGVAPSGEAYLSLLAQGEPVWVATEASRRAVQQGLSEMDEWGAEFK